MKKEAIISMDGNILVSDRFLIDDRRVKGGKFEKIIKEKQIGGICRWKAKAHFRQFRPLIAPPSASLRKIKADRHPSEGTSSRNSMNFICNIRCIIQSTSPFLKVQKNVKPKPYIGVFNFFFFFFTNTYYYFLWNKFTITPFCTLENGVPSKKKYLFKYCALVLSNIPSFY